jgi:hypothetical protein
MSVRPTSMPSSDFTVSKATRSKLNAFGIEFEGKSGLSKSEIR